MPTQTGGFKLRPRNASGCPAWEPWISCVWSKSERCIQYNLTASFRAMATFASGSRSRPEARHV
jgi:hypothetical protein